MPSFSGDQNQVFPYLEKCRNTDLFFTNWPKWFLVENMFVDVVKKTFDVAIYVTNHSESRELIRNTPTFPSSRKQIRQTVASFGAAIKACEKVGKPGMVFKRFCGMTLCQILQ